MPAVPREHRVSTAGGAAVEITNRLMATASGRYNDSNRSLQLRPLSPYYGFHPIATACVALNRSIVAHCSYSVCGFITITIAHCTYSEYVFARIIVTNNYSLRGFITFKNHG